VSRRVLTSTKLLAAVHFKCDGESVPPWLFSTNSLHAKSVMHEINFTHIVQGHYRPFLLCLTP